MQTGFASINTLTHTGTHSNEMQTVDKIGTVARKRNAQLPTALKYIYYIQMENKEKCPRSRTDLSFSLHKLFMHTPT